MVCFVRRIIVKRNFYFFRHGQRNGIDAESTLNNTGIAQANKLAEYLDDKNIEVVYSSPFKRAIDTAKRAINNDNIKIITEEEFAAMLENN